VSAAPKKRENIACLYILHMLIADILSAFDAFLLHTPQCKALAAAITYLNTTGIFILASSMALAFGILLEVDEVLERLGICQVIVPILQCREMFQELWLSC
jgi:hypothetical protein